MNYIVIDWEAIAGTSLGYLSMKATYTICIDVCDQTTLRLPKK